MTKYNKRNSLEKEYNRIIRKRRIIISVAVISVLAVLGIVIGTLLHFHRKETLVIPTYEKMDAESPQYWQERSLFNINYVRNLKLPESEQAKHLLTLTRNDIGAANRLESTYGRVRAIMDIAMTLAQNDVDINIDNAVREIEEKDSAHEICGRIYISQALMHLRLNNRSAAKASVIDYTRLLVANDLKLSSSLNELSFCGAVTVFSILDDSGSLNDLFQKQLSYSPRAGIDNVMRAYRIIIGEMVRTGRGRQAIESLSNITDSVEFCRACQLIIALTARPPEIKPLEPAVISETILQSESSLPPLKNEQFVANIINEVINCIINSESEDQQFNTLVRLSGSRIMCDPDIYKLFKTAVKENRQIERMIKNPILRLLEEPQSETIRIALKMPPIPEEKRAKVDMAQDKWNVSWGAYAGADDVISPEVLKNISDVRLFRTLSRTVLAYLTASRLNDAARVLQKAKEVAAGMDDPSERTSRLLATAELQIGAGDISAARNTLLEVGLPQKTSAETPKTPEEPAAEDDDTGDNTTVYTEKRLSELARMQIISRFFDDSLKTIQCINSEATRNDDYAFLVQELIQVGLTDEAKKIIEKITDTTIKSEKTHILAVLENGLNSESVEHLEALRVFWTEQLQSDDDLVRCVKQLIRRGLLQTALTVVNKINDSKTKSENISRIAVEYLQLWTAYSGKTEQHQAIRAFLQKQTFDISEIIPDVLIRSQTLQKAVAAMLPEADETNELKEILKKTVNGLLAPSSPFMTLDSRKNETPPEIKSQLLTELLLQKIALERVIREDTDKLPYVDVELDKNLYTEIRKGVDVAVELLNESEETFARSITLSNLGLILMQTGRNQAAMQMLQEAEAAANGLPDKAETVTVMLSVPPIFQLLGQNNAARETFHRLTITVSESFVMKKGDLESVLHWRQRDVELDRIVRKMIQMDYIADAVGFSAMITEPVISDRLQRSVSYICLDKNHFPEAEASARRITNAGLRHETIQDVLFIRKMAEQEQKQKDK